LGKALQGAAELGGAVALGVGAFLDPALLASPLYEKAMWGLALGGVSSIAGAVADALVANRGTNITTRQPAANRQIVYGEQRVGGVMVYASTTGSHKDQYNKVIVMAGHTIDGVVNHYLDGRQVYFDPGSEGQTTCPGGYTFGGTADGTKYYDQANVSYNFGGLVYATAKYGSQTAADGADPSLAANDPTWAATSNGVPYLGGCSWMYLKVEYDANQFPNQPEVRMTIRGKNDIWDPRTNTTGYTTNWALCVADFLLNAEYGLGCPQSEINTAQLITAANICDEQVTLANGNTEPRYTFNSSFDTTTAPGDVLNSMMAAAGGNIVWSSGQWYIFPASAIAPSFGFTDADLLDTVQWQPYRSMRDLCNRVKGVYTAPNYPYSPVGNYYDANGFDPDGYRQNNFNYQWQKTDYPPYAQDTLHGYATDAFLTDDGGIELWDKLDLPATISVATSQRLAKIHLMLNRTQGTGVLSMSMSAWRMMAMDVFELTYAPFGWVNKQLQVTQIDLVTDRQEGQAPRLYCQVQVREYDPNNYAWSASEELTILDTPPIALQTERGPVPPTEMTLNSGAGFDVVNGDGIVTPRVQVVWTDPEDAYTTQITIEWQPQYGTQWTTAGNIPVGNQLGYITGVTAGQVINVRISSLRASGARSTYLEIVGYTVSATSLSTVNSGALAVGVPFNVSNDCTIDTVATESTESATLRVYGPGGVGTNWDLVYGQGTVSVPAMTSPVDYSSSGYVILILPGGKTFADAAQGDIFPEPNFNQTIADNIILLGQYAAVDSAGTGGVTGGGGTGGNGGGGSRGTACTVEGTLLDTPNGPVSNIILKNRFDMGAKVYLSGESGPEKLVSARWVQLPRYQRIKVGDVSFDCSDTHTVSVDGIHIQCAKVPTGSVVDTRTGREVMERTPVTGNVRVLELTLSGPSHVYSVGGVLTHNTTKIGTQPGTS
jgi:hypothetical protein